jgi:peptide-methionine (S)-S-oxide reductase
MKIKQALVLAAVLLAAAATAAPCSGQTSAAEHRDSSAAPEALEIATFAGGCFWCVESDFDGVPGVVRTVSGYTGGHLEDPTYRQVSSGTTGHREAVQIHFDPQRVGYAELLQIFWRSIDPTDAGGQFCDRGHSYTTAIFANTAEQQRLAEASKKGLQSEGILKQPVVTSIEAAGAFYPAEDYHQDYYQKNPLRYKFYRLSCRRDQRVRDLWGEQAFRGIAAH